MSSPSFSSVFTVRDFINEDVLKQHGQRGEFKCSRYYGEDEKHLFIVTEEGGEDGNSTK